MWIWSSQISKSHLKVLISESWAPTNTLLPYFFISDLSGLNNNDTNQWQHSLDYTQSRQSSTRLFQKHCFRQSQVTKLSRNKGSEWQSVEWEDQGWEANKIRNKEIKSNSWDLKVSNKWITYAKQVYWEIKHYLYNLQRGKWPWSAER